MVTPEKLDNNPRFIAYGTRNQRARAAEHIMQHFDDLVDQQLTEFYDAPATIFPFDKTTQTFEAVGGEAKEDALMKLWLVADARAQANTDSHHQAGVMASYEVIYNSHERLGQKQPARTFTVIPAHREDKPYWRMRPLRRTADGQTLSGGYGINYSARVFVGAVVLENPRFDASSPDPEARELVMGAFLARMRKSA